MCFELAHDLSERQGDHEIEAGRNDIRRDRTSGCHDRLRVHDHFHDTHGSEQRGVLVKQDEFAGHSRNHTTNGLRDDHEEHRLCAIHAERARSFELALRNRLNACAEYLAQVSTRVHRQDHHAKREGRHLDACKWKSEERDIDL